MVNVSITGYEWTIRARIIRDNSSNDTNSTMAVLIGQSTAVLDNDGYIRFTNLGLSLTESGVVIEYSFDLPVGIDEYLLHSFILLPFHKHLRKHFRFRFRF